MKNISTSNELKNYKLLKRMLTLSYSLLLSTVFFVDVKLVNLWTHFQGYKGKQIQCMDRHFELLYFPPGLIYQYACRCIHF